MGNGRMRIIFPLWPAEPAALPPERLRLTQFDRITEVLLHCQHDRAGSFRSHDDLADGELGHTAPSPYVRNRRSPNH